MISRPALRESALRIGELSLIFLIFLLRLRDALLEVGFRTTNEILGQILLR
jgi:hypothetical protein